jgi:hypothetical protein
MSSDAPVDDVGVIQAMKFWTTEDDEDWFNVWWLDSPASSLQCRSNFSSAMSRFLDFVQNKGNAHATKKTPCIGRRVHTSNTSHLHGTDIKTRFFSGASNKCIPYAFLNVIRASQKERKYVMKTFANRGGFGGLSDLARVSSNIGVRLRKFRRTEKPTLAWILKQHSGRFLIVNGVHCVGIDCADDLVWDCAEGFALRLCHDSLQACGIVKVDQIRRIWTINR